MIEKGLQHDKTKPEMKASAVRLGADEALHPRAGGQGGGQGVLTATKSAYEKTTPSCHGMGSVAVADVLENGHLWPCIFQRRALTAASRGLSQRSVPMLRMCILGPLVTLYTSLNNCKWDSDMTNYQLERAIVCAMPWRCHTSIDRCCVIGIASSERGAVT